MDAPLVLSTRIDPEEIDDESHNLDVFERFPLKFFEESQKPLKPQEIVDMGLIDNVSMHLGTDLQYHDLMFHITLQAFMQALKYVFTSN